MKMVALQPKFKAIGVLIFWMSGYLPDAACGSTPDQNQVHPESILKRPAKQEKKTFPSVKLWKWLYMELPLKISVKGVVLCGHYMVFMSRLEKLWLPRIQDMELTPEECSIQAEKKVIWLLISRSSH